MAPILLALVFACFPLASQPQEPTPATEVIATVDCQSCEGLGTVSKRCWLCSGKKEPVQPWPTLRTDDVSPLEDDLGA